MTGRAIGLVLAKSPVPGRVKTRLCPPADPRTAARLAAAALMDTIASVSGCPTVTPVVALAGSLDDAELSAELRVALAGIPVIGQRGGTLGERIAAAHRDAATMLPGRAVIQVGMDTPQADSVLLTRCVEQLGRPESDALLGHAVDGGWWILGLRDPHAAAVLRNIPTSRPDTGQLTAQALTRLGMRLATAPTLSDVDTMTDAHEVARLAPDSRFAAELSTITEPARSR